ncbi:serine/threonine-protein kinase fray2-like [Battus philenor]|uniref:serine/threonine-protein kinase fray2-like n=1 Tax=Battus philenor TaxID=42288 RepID=UPI0035D0821A
MGLMLSIVISYAGINDTIECLKHIIRGVVPDGEPDFQDYVEYYARLLHKSTNQSTNQDWIKESGQGYLVLTEDKKGSLKSAAIKYYGQTRTAAILFSTKISSFGQESFDENSKANGDYRKDRNTPTKTKTIISNNSESFSVGTRSRISTPQNTLDSNYSGNSFDNEEELNAAIADKEKLSWHYKPQSPSRKQLPEIHFQSYDAERDNPSYSEEFLRSLDGIKFRPLQRNDPSGRRRSFRKRRSSSSNSSKDSKASRDEELKMFTSLEEEEFRKMNDNENFGRFGSTPNLSTRSYSRSRSREKSKEKRNDRWSTEVSVDSAAEEKDLSRLDSFAEEKDENKDGNEVTDETEDDVDFWANFGD